jgi:hypothetical protein
MNKKYENKVRWGSDVEFMAEHIDEIIDAVDLEARKGILLPPFFHDFEHAYPVLYQRLNEKFTEVGINGFFHHPVAKPGETEGEAITRMIKEFCDDTNLWGIYKWVTPEERERKIKEE